MKYELIELKWITERGNIALIKRGDKHKEYAVVRDLDVEEPFESNVQWSRTVEYYSADIEGLQKAVDCFRRKSEYEYISRARLEELATLFKDGLIEDDEIEALHYFDDVCEMTPEEEKFFGIECNDKDQQLSQSFFIGYRTYISERK